MQYRKMGSLDWQVSALGFGAMRLPTRRNSMLSRMKHAEAKRILRHGIDLGINYIDTAYVYHLGGSEKILGETLKDGYREKVKLVTKSPIYFIRKSEDFDKYLKRQINKLQTDYLDAYLFHGLNRNNFKKVKELKLVDKMVEARDQGLIKHIGFSFHDTLPIFKEIIDYYDWDITQIQHNYMDTSVQATTEGLKYAAEKGIAVVIMGPVKGGRLANPPQEALDVMRKAQIQRAPVDWALQFLWNQPEVSVVLSGMSSMQQVVDNCKYASKSGANTLNQNDLDVITELAAIYKKKELVPCTTCQYCMPCPSGVNIPENFALLNNFSIESGSRRKKRALKNYKKLIGDPEKVNLNKPNGNATVCTRCNECIDKCPQEIMIPDDLEKVHAILAEKKEISDFFK